MIKNAFWLFVLAVFMSCSRGGGSSETPVIAETPKTLEIRGADFSFLPEVRASGQVFYDQNGAAEDMLTTFKNAGGNVVRLRIWVNPSTATSGFASVKALAQEVKSKGMKVLISVHYSDSWADPAQQTKPAAWQNDSFDQLKTDVYNFTKQIVQEINPDYIQIGNEINNGILWPEGNISNLSQFKSLIQSGISAVRASSFSTKIILHYAGFSGADVFFKQMTDLDYDIIGLSYYPIWHGKDLAAIKSALNTLGTNYGKSILIAETSYPFTLGWNDQTQNIIGDSSQLIAQYPATEDGQKNYLLRIRDIAKEVPKCIGFCYWGGEWTAYKGKTARDGSTYENQALWNFSNKATGATEGFGNK